MIGDKYEKDIVGAKKLGMKTVLYDKTGQELPFPLADAAENTFLKLDIHAPARADRINLGHIRIPLRHRPGH